MAFMAWIGTRQFPQASILANILLVDDDAMLRDVLQQMLELDGHRVVCADDGAAGLRMFHAEPSFDLVVADRMMPNLDGAGLIDALRSAAPDLPILAISGGRLLPNAGAADLRPGAASASAYLAKPFNRAQLQAAVTALLCASG